MNNTNTNRLCVIGTQGTQYGSMTIGHHQGFLYLDYWYSEVQTPATAVVANKWYHLVIVHKGPGTTASGSQEFYLNNVKQPLTLHSTNNSNGTFSLVGNGLTIGNQPVGGVPLNGSIANFRLFNRVLTSDEIWQLYAYQKEYFGHGDLGMTLKAGRLGIGTSEPRAMLDVRGDTFSRVFKGGRATFLTWDYLGQRVTTITAPANFSSYPNEANIIDYTFDIPSCYHDLARANLKAYVKIDWRGEVSTPWNFGFRIEVTYNGNTLIHSSSSDAASSYNNRICGIPTIGYFNDNGSTPEHASVTSLFNLPDCDVSPGSTLKVQRKGSGGDYTSGHTIYTGRTWSNLNQPDYELPISSFFVILDVVDGY